MKNEAKVKQMAQRLKDIVDERIDLMREMSALLDIRWEDVSKALEGGMIPKVQRRIEDMRGSLRDIEMGLEMIFRASLPIMAHEEEWKDE